MNTRYDARALRELKGIHRYIARDDPAAASRVISRIEKSIARLVFAPLAARPGVVAGTRLLVVPGTPYLVVYRVRPETIDIVAVLHSARNRRD
jgi:toxin ParE1/3/4